MTTIQELQNEEAIGEAPLLSLALPVYNGENFLDEAIESILRQDFTDFELLIGDNGSTDATEKICREFEASDPRVKYFRSEENRGACWNYNRLFPVARGRYFKWCAHDDLLAPGFLKRCIEELELAPDDVVVVFPKTVIIDEESRPVDTEFVCDLDFPEHSAAQRMRRYLDWEGEQHAIFGVFRTDALRRTALTGNFWGGDIGLLSELLCQGRFKEIPDRLFLRRYHPGTSLVASNNNDAGEVAAWFDTSKKGKNAWPRTRLFWEISKGVMRSPNSAVDKARIEAVVAGTWVPHYWRVMGGEAKRAVKWNVGKLRHKLANR